MSKVIGWWSGGITSAVTCRLIIDLYGIDSCRFIFQDTKNEHEDTYRFKEDCERWYNKEIETISRIGTDYDAIQDVWRRFKSLNVAHGAICSSELKRELRIKWQRENDYKHQAFGFDTSEINRAKGMVKNYPKTKPIFPLLMYGLGKKDCIKIVEDAGLQVPIAYQLGFHNNNCLNTGCIQGGIGYWQKMSRDFPEKYDRMSEIEHELTDLKGKPVTMLKDQSKAAKESGRTLVFLKPHPDYPEYKDLSMMEGREPKPLMECNGFCGINDLDTRSETEQEINFDGGDEIDLFTQLNN